MFVCSYYCSVVGKSISTNNRIFRSLRDTSIRARDHVIYYICLLSSDCTVYMYKENKDHLCDHQVGCHVNDEITAALIRFKRFRYLYLISYKYHQCGKYELSNFDVCSNFINLNF